MTEQLELMVPFRERTCVLLDLSLSSLQDELSWAPQGRLARTRKLIQVADLLCAQWRTGTKILLTERHIAEQCSLLGNTEPFEARVPEMKKISTTLRTVRSLIEELRKTYRFPVLSTPAVKKKEQESPAPAGYWIPMEMKEVEGYLRRTLKELLNVIESRIDTHEAVANIFNATTADLSQIRSEIQKIKQE